MPRITHGFVREIARRTAEARRRVSLWEMAPGVIATRKKEGGTPWTYGRYTISSLSMRRRASPRPHGACMSCSLRFRCRSAGSRWTTAAAAAIAARGSRRTAVDPTRSAARPPAHAAARQGELRKFIVGHPCGPSRSGRAAPWRSPQVPRWDCRCSRARPARSAAGRHH